MKDSITNAAEITILPPIDNNYKTGGGDISVGGCLLLSRKGRPFTPQPVYGGTTDIEDIFGKPFYKSVPGMEGLRHLHDAVQECSYVNAVRVVDTLTYRFPSLTFLVFNGAARIWTEGENYVMGDVVEHKGKKYLCAYANTSTNANAPDIPEQSDWLEFTGGANAGAHRYNEEVVAGDGAFMVIYPIDGDDSRNRVIRILDVDKDKKRFTVAIYDKDELGEEYLLESHNVGVDKGDTDDMGLSAYIKAVFDRQSTRFRVDYMEGTTWEDIEAALLADETTRTLSRDFKFEGGTAGDMPDTSDWNSAVDIFRDEKIACNLLFAAGVYEQDVIVSLADVADGRHISFFYDIPPGLKSAEAIEWDQDMGLTSRHARAYYSPYSANDPWYGGKCVWGVSGAMAAAKARCNKIVTAGSTPGVHYAPAGESRFYLSRTGLASLFPGDRINRDSLYDARINPIVPITSGGCGADDDMTHWFKTNYLRFGWINDVLDYIDHRFYEGAQQVKFEPDGLTRESLMDMTTVILDDLVTSGALVAPREPERDGTNPYIVTVQQLEIDLWKVTWEVCITGAARRIVGQPKLIR